jgi:hypothetical protein
MVRQLVLCGARGRAVGAHRLQKEPSFVVARN